MSQTANSVSSVDPTDLFGTGAQIWHEILGDLGGMKGRAALAWNLPMTAAFTGVDVINKAQNDAAGPAAGIATGIAAGAAGTATGLWAGAAAGAVFGSLFPGIGTFLGIAIGGVVGLYTSDQVESLIYLGQNAASEFGNGEREVIDLGNGVIITRIREPYSIREEVTVTDGRADRTTQADGSTRVSFNEGGSTGSYSISADGIVRGEYSLGDGHSGSYTVNLGTGAYDTMEVVKLPSGEATYRHWGDGSSYKAIEINSPDGYQYKHMVEGTAFQDESGQPRMLVDKTTVYEKQPDGSFTSNTWEKNGESHGEYYDAQMGERGKWAIHPDGSYETEKTNDVGAFTAYGKANGDYGASEIYADGSYVVEHHKADGDAEKYFQAADGTFGSETIDMQGENQWSRTYTLNDGRADTPLKLYEGKASSDGTYWIHTVYDDGSETIQERTGTFTRSWSKDVAGNIDETITQLADNDTTTTRKEVDGDSFYSHWDYASLEDPGTWTYSYDNKEADGDYWRGTTTHTGTYDVESKFHDDQSQTYDHQTFDGTTYSQTYSWQWAGADGNGQAVSQSSDYVTRYDATSGTSSHAQTYISTDYSFANTRNDAWTDSRNVTSYSYNNASNYYGTSTVSVGSGGTNYDSGWSMSDTTTSGNGSKTHNIDRHVYSDGGSVYRHEYDYTTTAANSGSSSSGWYASNGVEGSGAWTSAGYGPDSTYGGHGNYAGNHGYYFWWSNSGGQYSSSEYAY